MISFAVDLSPHKQGRYILTSHVFVGNEQILKPEKPDFIVILLWNIKEEIMKQLRDVREWGGKFVVVIPKLKIE